MTILKSLRPAHFAQGAVIATGVAISLALAFPGMPDPRVIAERPADPIVTKELATARELMRNGEWQAAADMVQPYVAGGDPAARYEYALMLSKGWGVPRDLDKARLLMLQSAQQTFAGQADAAYELGKMYRISHGGDCQRIAFEWFVKAAELGNRKAHLELAKSWLKGLGIDRDPAKAIEHYAIAADNGSAVAALQLVSLYSQGAEGFPADAGRAETLLARFLPQVEKDAVNGDRSAARSLGRIFDQGRIVPRNQRSAMRWYAMAADAGDASAMHDLAMLAAEREDGSLEPARIVELLRASAERGYSAAHTSLGRLGLKSRYGLSATDAVAEFERGVDAGHGGAMEELARLYVDGKLVARDLEKARELAMRGTGLGHAGCRKLLEELNTRNLAEAARQRNLVKRDREG